jgi:GDP-L-fucose synthase
MNLTGKRILVTGGTGLIGRELVELLIPKNPLSIRVVSLDDKSRAHPNVEFHRIDLRDTRECKRAVANIDVVFHLMGIKGSPKVSKERPSDFFVSVIQCNTNMMDAAFRENVQWYLYTSSVGVYYPADMMKETDVWKTMPSENDWYPGWAKRVGELQAETYRIQYGWKNWSIVRPANVYGRYDNYDASNAMVIPSIIRRIVDGENPLVVWGDGTSIRDFIYAKDCAAGMIHAVEKEINEPINLGSGTGITIRQFVDTIVEISDEKPSVVWDVTKPSGDKKRVLDVSTAASYGFSARTSFRDGLEETYRFYKNNKELVSRRYNIFNETEAICSPK